jgi:hypothetical protein
MLILLLTVLASLNAYADSDCTAPQDHTAADAVRQITNLVYAPFADYPFTDDGLCIDPKPFQVLADVFLRGNDGSVPQIESLCINRPSNGNLQIHWTLGPTPEATLLVIAGENDEVVRSHDFWHVNFPQTVACSKKLQLEEAILERDGGIDLILQGNNAEIRVHGLSLSIGLPNSKLPSFLTHDLGVDAFLVSEPDQLTAKLSAPLFNLPVSAVGDIGPDDPLTMNILGFRFRVK